MFSLWPDWGVGESTCAYLLNVSPSKPTSPGLDGDLPMATFVLTYAFRCGTCNATNDDKLVLASNSRKELARTMRRTHLGCKFCGSPTADRDSVMMSFDVTALLAGCSPTRRGITEIRDSDPSDDFEPC